MKSALLVIVAAAIRCSAETYMGTGWPIESGYVVTNYHVVAGSQYSYVHLASGEKLLARIAERDAANDLVLLICLEHHFPK